MREKLKTRKKPETRTESKLNKGIKGKLMLGALLTLSVMLLLAGCGKQGTAGTAETSEKLSLTIADTVSNPTFQVALAEGIFEKYSIDAKIATFATPAEGINALFINQVNAAYGADFPVLNAVSKGEYSIIASTGTGLSDKDAANWKLFVREDVQTPADLKGKKVSNFRGTFVSFLWDKFLQQHGLNNEDVEIIGQGGFDESYVALKSGDIDGVWVTGATLIDKFSSLEGVHQLTDMSQTEVRTGGEIIIPNELLEKNAEGVKNFLRAIEEASQFIQANPERVADIMYEKVKQPREMTLADLDNIQWTLQFSEQAYNTIVKQKEYMVAAGIIQQDFEIKDKLKLAALKDVLPERVTFEP